MEVIRMIPVVGTMVDRTIASWATAAASHNARLADGSQPWIVGVGTSWQFLVGANLVYMLVTLVLYNVMRPYEQTKPLNNFLRPIVALYNLTCIFLAGYVVVGLVQYKMDNPGARLPGEREPAAGLFVCNSVDEKLAWVFWVFYAQKFWVGSRSSGGGEPWAQEFLDTWVFLLRCSFRQVSTLHLFHHSSITVVVGSLLKCTPPAGLGLARGRHDYGGDMFLPILCNAVVHTLMYSHYLCTVFKIKTP